MAEWRKDKVRRADSDALSLVCPGDCAVTATRFHLQGQLAAPGFADWVCDRAARLDLTGWVRSDGPSAMTIVVAGPPTLVDAMEMACSLGPMDVLVERIERSEHPLDDSPEGFEKL